MKFNLILISIQLSEMSHIFFRVLFTCLTLRLKVPLLGIIPKIAIFAASVLMFLAIFIMFFAMASGSSLDGKLLAQQFSYLFWGKFLGRLDVIFHTLCFGSTK